MNGYLHLYNMDRVVMGNISHIILLSSSVNKSIRRAKKARIIELSELVDCHSVTSIESATVIWYVSTEFSTISGGLHWIFRLSRLFSKFFLFRVILLYCAQFLLIICYCSAISYGAQSESQSGLVLLRFGPFSLFFKFNPDLSVDRRRRSRSRSPRRDVRRERSRSRERRDDRDRDRSVPFLYIYSRKSNLSNRVCLARKGC